MTCSQSDPDFNDAKSAIERGDAAALRAALARAPALRQYINAPIGSFGARPIHMASKSKDVLDVLIDNGADINLRSEWDNGPYTVLDSAPEDVARHVISRGAKLTAHAAARLGWFDELRQLVDADPKVVHERGGDGQMPLHFAKTVEIADFLLDRGAQIDARCIDHKSTPAQYALAERPEVCRRLIERGATPDIFMPARLGDVALATKLIEENPPCKAARVNWSNYAPVPPFNIYCWTLGWFASPHEIALQFNHRDVHGLLLRNSPPVVRILDAAWRGDEAAASAVLRDAPDVMSSFQPEHHALFAHAVHHQRDDGVRLMLNLNFDPTAPGTDGGTALHQAAWVGRADYIELLLPRCTAIINQPDPTHHGTPLGWAKYGSVHRCNERGDYPRAIELLTAAGAV